MSNKKLSLEQETKLFLKPCKTKKELAAWIKRYLKLHLPDFTVSRYSDTNPLQVIWEVYDICVNRNNPDKVQELLYVAGRGSGKTLGMAIAELMILLHDQREVVHVGAIQNQAERCYAYQKNFLFSRQIKPIVIRDDLPEEQRILEKANMSKSLFNVSGQKLTLEVIPCTLKACLVSETEAQSQEGIKQLKDFKKGDLIKSPQGWVEVLDNTLEYRECVRIELEDGKIIEGTLDHKVWTNQGWVELKDLNNEHEILEWQ